MRRLLLANLCAAALLAGPANAAVSLIAKGSLGGTSDLSGLNGTLENGLAANILGGLGSGLTYAGGSGFLATPDRGPNATPYNSLVDDTTSYISRFQSLRLNLKASSAGSALPFDLTTKLYRTTLLSSPTALVYGTGAGLGLGSGAPTNNDANSHYFTGRSDNYDPTKDSGNAANARFDPESIRISSDGRSVFVSDEYGPYIRQFDRNNGSLIKTFKLPDNLNVTTLSAQGNTEISGNTVGRVANKGMEGLALTPDGKTLVGIMQAPLEQDAAIKASKNTIRIVTVDIASGDTHEFAYNLTSSGVSDIVAINDHQFLVDERDGKGLGDGSNAAFKKLYLIDIAGATDVTTLSGKAVADAAVTKTLFLDVGAALLANGFTADQIPAKIEGITFGQDVLNDGVLTHTLFIANDNDFVPGVAGPNQFFVFGFTDADLPGFLAQSIITTGVPEPTSWALMLGGFGLVGAVARRRANVVTA